MAGLRSGEAEGRVKDVEAAAQRAGHGDDLEAAMRRAGQRDDEVEAVAANAGTTASERIRRAAVAGVRAVFAAGSASLAVMYRYGGELEFMLEGVFCTLLVGAVDTALGEAMSLDDDLPLPRRILLSAEVVLAYAIGGIIPVLAAMAPPAGRLPKLVGACTLALAAFGMVLARASRKQKKSRVVLRCFLKSLLAGWMAMGVGFIILNHLARIFRGDNWKKQ